MKSRKSILAEIYALRVIQFDLPTITKYFVKRFIYQKPNQRTGKLRVTMFNHHFLYFTISFHFNFVERLMIRSCIFFCLPARNNVAQTPLSLISILSCSICSCVSNARLTIKIRVWCPATSKEDGCVKGWGYLSFEGF